MRTRSRQKLDPGAHPDLEPERRSHLVWAAAAASIAALLLYGRSLGLSFAYDDIDHLNGAADVLAGRDGLLANLFRPHNQHVLPAFRVLVLASAFLFGTKAAAIRLVIFLSHIGSALFLALTARKLCPGRATAATTALAYVLPAGLSSMVLWFPVAATVTLGMLGICGALAAVVHREELGETRSRVLALAGIVLALAFESGLVPMVVCVVLVDEMERRRRREVRTLGLVAVVGLTLAVATTLFVTVASRRQTGAGIPIQLDPALRRAIYLPLVAPFRLLFPGLGLPRTIPGPERFPIQACAFGLLLILAGAACCAALLRRRSVPLALASAATLVSALGYSTLVALGRWKLTYEELYDADRYLYPYLLPFALLSGALAVEVERAAGTWSPWRRRTAAALAMGALVPAVWVHARAVSDRIPWQVYADHARRFSQLEELGRRLSEAADRLPPDAPPLKVPDGAFFFDDVHNHRLSSRFLLFVATRGRSPRLQLGDVSVDARDQQLLAPVLEGWVSSFAGSLPAFSVRGGELRNMSDQGVVRFAMGPQNAAVVDGFYGLEGPYRWMKARGELHLLATSDRFHFAAAAPVSVIGHPIRVTVRVMDEGSAAVQTLGSVEIREDGIRTYDVAVPEPFASTVLGRPVRLILLAEPTWKPAEVLPGNGDSRSLSLQLYEAGFAP